MKKGFVTFVNNNPKYLELNDILIESILTFTGLEVEVLGINFDYKHPDKRVICKRYDVDNECIDNIYYAKTYASLQSGFDIGLQLDSDMIVTPLVVNLFNSISEEYQYVKGSLHPWNGPLKEPHIQIMQQLAVKEKTQPYVHATYLFTKNSKNFLKEVFDTGTKLLKNDIHPINYDETVLNALLWKNEVTDGFVTCYDPYFEYFKKHFGLQTFENVSAPYSSEPNFGIDYYICHACKNSKEAKNIFEKIKRDRKL